MGLRSPGIHNGFIVQNPTHHNDARPNFAIGSGSDVISQWDSCIHIFATKFQIVKINQQCQLEIRFFNLKIFITTAGGIDYSSSNSLKGSVHYLC